LEEIAADKATPQFPPSPVPIVVAPKAAKPVPPGRPQFLHLFSGPENRPDGLSNFLRNLGWDVTDIDVVNPKEGPGSRKYGNDLTNQAAWDAILLDIASGVYSFVFMGTPCNSFTRLRHHPGGPPPLRSHKYPLGPPNQSLSKSDKDTLRRGNYFALQSATASLMCIKHGVGFAIENPEPWNKDYNVKIWDLASFKHLASLPGVTTTDFDQCELGGAT
jgi:hypothetical protein